MTHLFCLNWKNPWLLHGSLALGMKIEMNRKLHMLEHDPSHGCGGRQALISLPTMAVFSYGPQMTGEEDDQSSRSTFSNIHLQMQFIFNQKPSVSAKTRPDKGGGNLEMAAWISWTDSRIHGDEGGDEEEEISWQLHLIKWFMKNLPRPGI